ncbi:hypothetical protein MOUN0_B03950 [Monosporozyma unispora]|nr:hypothetical protein C6P44_001169 [Kazachstania unispora]
MELLSEDIEEPGNSSEDEIQVDIDPESSIYVKPSCPNLIKITSETKLGVTKITTHYQEDKMFLEELGCKLQRHCIEIIKLRGEFNGLRNNEKPRSKFESNSTKLSLMNASSNMTSDLRTLQQQFQESNLGSRQIHKDTLSRL